MTEAISKGDLSAMLSPSLLDQLKRWFSLWGLSGFERSISIKFSGRLRRALGRCYVHRRQITIAAYLKEMNASVLEEVVCHEAAHLAVFQLHGEAARPHGREWAKLMRMAGYEPRRFMELDQADIPVSVRVPRYIYVHYCPVCQAERHARRPVRSWRCADCSALGLDGRIEIYRYPARKEGSS